MAELVDPAFHDGVLAEFAVLNMAVSKALAIAAAQFDDPEAFKKQLLELGLIGLTKTNYWSVPPERLPAFLEQVEARYTDLVLAIRPDQAPSGR